MLASQCHASSQQPVTAASVVSEEALDNLRAFFGLLAEWDREDRQERSDVGAKCHVRAERTIAKHYRGL